MSNAYFDVPVAANETVLSYAPGSPERDPVLKAYKEFYNGQTEVPLYINGKDIKTGVLEIVL